MNSRFIYLAKLGIIESNDEVGNYQIQKIDDPEDFKISNGLSFYPPKLESDDEAEAIFKSLTHSQLENLNNLTTS